MIDLEYYKKKFPSLKWDKKLKVFGDMDLKYNCVSHTINVDQFNVWPQENDKSFYMNTVGTISFWPKELPINKSLNNFLNFYQIFGYKEISDETLDKSVRKIAIFCKEGTDLVSHVSLMRGENLWSSKLGYGPLIFHQLHSLEGKEYGEVKCIIKRPITIKREYDWNIVNRYIKIAQLAQMNESLDSDINKNTYID